MKKQILKAVALCMATILAVGAMAGCSNKATDKDEQGRTILSVGGWPSKEGKELDKMTERKANFEAKNTDVVIEPDKWSFELKTFFAKATGGQLPDLFYTHYTEIPQIMEGEYAADLSKALKERGYDGKFNEKILELVSDGDKVYGFPYEAYILGVGFNTELMKEAGLVEADGTPKQPKDWYELAEFAVQIKEKTGKPGFVFPSSGNNGGWIFNPVAWSFGVDFMEQDKDGNWKATFNTPEAVEALQFIKDLKWKYDVLPANTLIDGTEYYKTFATGNAGMLIAAGDMPRRLTQYGMKPDQIGMMAMPAGPKRHVTLIGGNVYCVSEGATDDQIDAALRWIEMTSDYRATEEYKANTVESLDTKLEKGQLVGIKSMSPWAGDTESVAYLNKMIDGMANSNPNHVKLYNEFVANCPAEVQAEEPVCTQELYGILDACIQEVLTNKDADCKSLVEKANADFQSNYLDNLDF